MKVEKECKQIADSEVDVQEGVLSVDIHTNSLW